jgi:hypothetical protein
VLRYGLGVLTLRRVFTVLLTAVLIAAPLQANASVAGSTCKKLNQTVVSEGLMHRCVKSGSKLVWDAGTQVLKNFSPAPTPKIGGKPQVGSTLRANAGNWAQGTALSFQWLVSGNPIPGANDAVFVPPPALAGKKVQVMVTAKQAGYNTLKKTSAETAAIAKATVAVKPPSDSPANLLKVGDPSLTGEGKVGTPVTVDPGSWDNGVTFKYQWLRDGVAITGATARTFVVRLEDFGSTLVARVQGTKTGFVSQVKMSEPLLVASNLEEVALATPPLVTGEALVGKQLTSKVLSWGPGVSIRYQWLRNGAPISGATSGTYALQKADINSYISLQLVGVTSGYAPTMRLSNPIGPVLESAPVKPITGFSIPSVIGIYQVGESLLANPGVWEDAVSFAYQWNRNGAPIPGATFSRYELTEEDINKFVTVTITGVKQGFSSIFKTSNPTSIVKNGALNIAERPEVTGDRIVGKTLTARLSSATPSLALTYQWVRQGAVIPGATDRTYELTDADVGYTVNVMIKVTRAGFDALTLLSSDYSLVTSNKITIAPQPSIIGTPVIGASLQANAGAWQSGVTLEYQWQRNGQSIPGARSATYKLQASDQGALITVSVLGTRSGLISVERISSQFGPIKPLSITPQFSCSCSVGETLTANATGDWQSENNPSMAYQWLRGTTPITGATSARYTLTEADAGQMVSVRIVLSQAGYPEATGTSLQRGPVTTNALQLTPTPTIAGTPIYLGSPLSVVTGTWDSNVTLSYRWYLNGSPISNATGTTLSLSSSTYVGKQIYVVVTGTKSGVPSVTRQSEPVTILGAKQTLTPTPVLSGTIQVGNTITANIGTWDTSTVKTFRWLRDGVAIAGATTTQYVLGSEDVGKIVSFEVTSTRTNYQQEIRTAALATVVPAAQLLSVTPPVISGNTVLGSTLVSTWGTWSATGTYSFQWMRNGVDIPGASGTIGQKLLIGTITQPFYVLQAEDVGAKISVRVTASKPLYPTATATSAETSPVTTNSLTNTPTPTIAGRVKVGFTLAADAGTWDSGASFTYQWLRNGNVISGATGRTYDLVSADEGTKISVRVTGKTSSSLPVAKTSSETGTVESAALTNTPTPIISSNTGQYEVGAKLNYSLPGWNFITEGYQAKVQWFRNGTAVPADAGLLVTSYTLTAADLNATITVRVTYQTNAVSVAKTSAGVGPVVVAAAVASTQPSITFGSPIRPNSVITGNVGNWNVASVGYVWLRNGVQISGGLTPVSRNSVVYYTATTLDVGAKISLKVSSATLGYTGTATSIESSTVEPLAATPGSVSITGNKTMGSLLTATPASWGSGTTFTYQWFRNGSAIQGATGTTYTVVQADSAASITVVATGARSGYTTVSSTSVAHVILIIPTQARILSTSVMRDSVTLNLDAVTGVSYRIQVYSPSNALVKDFTCSSNCSSILISTLASSTTWKIDVTATAPGGTAPIASTTATTYATLTLTPTITSATRVGDQITFNVDHQPGWRYKMRTHATNCGIYLYAPWVYSSPVVVMTTISDNCYYWLDVADPYGNTGTSASLRLRDTGAYDPPTFRPEGSNIGSTTVQPGALVSYNIDVYAMKSITVEVSLYNSAGQQVTLPSTNRPALASGTVWDGRYPGQMLLPGSLAYGQYQVRATAFAGSKSTTYVLGTISYPDPNPPAPSASPTVSPSVPASSSPSTSPSPSPSTSPTPTDSSDSGTVSASVSVTMIGSASLGGVLVLPGALLLWFFSFLKRRREGAMVQNTTRQNK